ncbi:MAG: phosphoribosyltransferase [Acidimicrobiia bacterium]
MTRRFRNRHEAGNELGALLADERGSGALQGELVVLGLPRGGVPVAVAVAQNLDAPVDIVVVRKLGVPGREELAMGAVASGGSLVMNQGLADELGITKEAIAAVVARESAELTRRESVYRMGRPDLDVADKTVVVVDDGIATGASMKVALEALRSRRPRLLCAAAPVASADACSRLGRVADSVIVVTQPEPFRAVGYWYDSFTQTTDDEVIALLS